MNKLFLMVTMSVAITACSKSKSTSVTTGSQSNKPLMMSFTDLKWSELPDRKKGMLFAVLANDAETGAFTQIRKVPPKTGKGPHAHSTELRVVVISGVIYVGPTLASARDFGPGSVIIMPPNWVHVSGCRAGSDCVFYQEGKGKFDFKPSIDRSSAEYH